MSLSDLCTSSTHIFFSPSNIVVNEGRLSANMVGHKCLSISSWTIWAVDGSKMSNSADNLVLLRYMQVVWLFLHIYRTHAQLPNCLFLINKKKIVKLIGQLQDCPTYKIHFANECLLLPWGILIICFSVARRMTPISTVCQGHLDS